MKICSGIVAKDQRNRTLTQRDPETKKEGLGGIWKCENEFCQFNAKRWAIYAKHAWLVPYQLVSLSLSLNVVLFYPESFDFLLISFWCRNKKIHIHIHFILYATSCLEKSRTPGCIFYIYIFVLSFCSN